MLFDILVTVPSLIMTEIAWCIRFAVALICMAFLFTLATGAIVLLCRRAAPRLVEKPEHKRPLAHA